MRTENTGFNHILLIPRGLKGTNSVPGHHVFNHLPQLLTPILFQSVPKIPTGGRRVRLAHCYRRHIQGIQLSEIDAVNAQTIGFQFGGD